MRYREAAKVQSETSGGFSMLEVHSLFHSARLHEVLCVCTPRWEPLYTARPLLPARPKSLSATGCTAPERRHLHLLNLPPSAGTRKASRSRAGDTRSARPDARERGSRAADPRFMCRSAGASEPVPQDPRPGGWGHGAHQGGGNRASQTARLNVPDCSWDRH